uniref:Uncharacterized protein n=1 Tax=Aegilops tauschii subsp. strangulata TaxID=200361 RepID=A0A453CEM5_AEGTS
MDGSALGPIAFFEAVVPLAFWCHVFLTIVAIQFDNICSNVMCSLPLDLSGEGIIDHINPGPEALAIANPPPSFDFL